jgi:hypothetical protein
MKRRNALLVAAAGVALLTAPAGPVVVSPPPVSAGDGAVPARTVPARTVPARTVPAIGPWTAVLTSTAAPGSRLPAVSPPPQPGRATGRRGAGKLWVGAGVLLIGIAAFLGVAEWRPWRRWRI